MPTEEGVGLEDEKGRLPILDATWGENNPEAIGLREARVFDLAINDNEVLREQSLLGDPVRLGARQMGGRAENHRMVDRLSKMQESLFKAGDGTDKQMGQPMVEGEPVNGRLENYQRLSAECISCSAEVQP